MYETVVELIKTLATRRFSFIQDQDKCTFIWALEDGVKTIKIIPLEDTTVFVALHYVNTHDYRTFVINEDNKENANETIIKWLKMYELAA